MGMPEDDPKKKRSMESDGGATEGQMEVEAKNGSHEERPLSSRSRKNRTLGARWMCRFASCKCCGLPEDLIHLSQNHNETNGSGKEDERGTFKASAVNLLPGLVEKATEKESAAVATAMAEMEVLAPAMGLESTIQFVDTHCHLEEVLCYAQMFRAVPSLKKRAHELSKEEREHWRVLGLEDDEDGVLDAVAESFERVWDRRWRDLSEEEKAAAQSVGYTSWKWDKGQWPLPRREAWEHLQEEIKIHLRVLGESAETWDKWILANGRKKLSSGSRRTWSGQEDKRDEEEGDSEEGEGAAAVENNEGTEGEGQDIQEDEDEEEDEDTNMVAGGQPSSNAMYERIWHRRWDQLSKNEHEAAKALGYSPDAWNRSEWLLPRRTPWGSLSPKVQSLLEVLGESEARWNMWSLPRGGGWASSNKFFSNGYHHSSNGAGRMNGSTAIPLKKKRKWSKTAARSPMSLGLSGTVTMKTVANRNGMGVLSGQPLRLWKELSSMETMAAGALGFTQRIWDMQEVADVESCLQEGLFGAGFEACITQGCDAESLDPAMKLALSHPKVYVSFGCHPKSAWWYTDELEARMLEAAKTCGPKTLAWGEFGLDYSHAFFGQLATNRQAQREVFARQLRIAVQGGWPLVIHTRAADRDTLRMMRRFVPQHWRVHVHSYRGGIAFLEALLAEWENCYIGVPGLVTLNDPLAIDLVRRCPVERMILETDAPYLPVQGYPDYSHPGCIPALAEAVAQVKDIPVADVLTRVRVNARAVYGI